MERRVFDQEYLDRLTQGDPEVESHFIGYFGHLLLVKLRFRLRSPQLVADARQETFLRVFTALRRQGTILHPERLGGFVNSVCDHVVLELYRSEGRAAQIPPNTPDPVDEKLSTELELITEERKHLVKETLARLSEADRKLIRGVFLEERDRGELCDELRIERTNLRVRLHRAMAKFRTALERTGPPKTFSAGGLH